MRVLVVVDHPYDGSFTWALVGSVRKGLEKAGHEVDLIDLHGDNFDPVMHAEDLAAWRHSETVDPLTANYQKRLLAADYLVMAFPIWWELMPAMTKGFIDKVIAKGVAYDQPTPNGLMKPLLGKTLQGVTLMTVMATPAPIYRLVFGNPITKAVFRGTFRKIGVRRLTWSNYSNLDSKSQSYRESVLTRTEQTFATLGTHG